MWILNDLYSGMESKAIPAEEQGHDVTSVTKRSNAIDLQLVQVCRRECV